MSNFYCPICDHVLNKPFEIGVICPNCFNEAWVTDHIDFEELGQVFSNSILMRYQDEITEEMKALNEAGDQWRSTLSFDLAHRLLREKWDDLQKRADGK